MDKTLVVMTAASVGYALGSIPFGYIVGKMRGVDLRKVGSGNIGATNAGRALGLRWFFIVFALDVLKGLIPVLTAWWLGPMLLGSTELSPDLMLIAGVGALAGHLFPVWLGFKGGKAVATGLGVMTGLCPPAAAAALLVFILVLLAWRYISLSSILAAIVAAPAFVIFTGGETWTAPFFGRFLLFVAAGLLIVWRHRSNLKRLAAGTEPKVGRLA